MFDPFRVQFLTISLDSQVILVLAGVVVAGLVTRWRARELGMSPEGMFDVCGQIALWTIAGARLGWVASHLDYYLRAPLQVAAIFDGGFLFASGVAAAAVALWRLRSDLGRSAAQFTFVAAPALATALVFDRAGCALTACGIGQPAQVEWALVRSGVSVHPVALYGLLVWLVGLRGLRAEALRGRPTLAWSIVSLALLVERTCSWLFGHEPADGMLAAAVLLALCGAFSIWNPNRLVAQASRS